MYDFHLLNLLDFGIYYTHITIILLKMKNYDKKKKKMSLGCFTLYDEDK